jgi:NADPH:quinone reductase-like Zn-dependent oxidoreductase
VRWARPESPHGERSPATWRVTSWGVAEAAATDEVLVFGFTEYGGPEVARFLRVPTPTRAEPGTVLVRMRAAGVNPADVKVRSGRRRGRVEVRFPMAMGREASGTVLATGPDVTHVVPGDEVFGSSATGSGALSEVAVLDATATARRPEAVSPEQAACIPVAMGTAYDALAQLALLAGSTLLVTGAGGGVGTSVSQLARGAGVRVVGLASAAKADLVGRVATDHVVSGDGWAERVRAVADGSVDAVLDTVGGPVLVAALGLARDPGRVISVADPGVAAQHGGGGVTRRRTTHVFGEVADLVAAGTVTPVISAVVPFERAADAVAEVETGHASGNVVVSRG